MEGKAWTKKHKDFDVTMGAKDGAEIAELTGIYLLEQINVFLKQSTQDATQAYIGMMAWFTLEIPMDPYWTESKKPYIEFSKATI